MRKPGTKNRSTLIKGLAAHGVKAKSVAKLNHKELAAKLEKLDQVDPILKEPPKVAVIPQAEAKTIVDEGRRRFKLMTAYYSPDKEVEIPDRVDDALCRAYFAPDKTAATACMTKALKKLHIHLLALWNAKKVTGPDTVENLAERLEAAKKWLARLEEQNADRAAIVRQKARVAAIESVEPRAFTESPWGGWA